MKISEILLRDPRTNPLPNQGQARIADRTALIGKLLATL